MVGLFNFTKHIKEIIKPQLKQIEFKNKGNHFYRTYNEYEEKIFIHGSRWNGNWNQLNEFFVNLYLIKDGKWIFFERIPNKPKYDKPDRFHEYYKAELKKREVLFTTEEISKIHEYTDGLMWRYSNEHELIELLKNAAEIIINQGWQYFCEIEKIIGNTSYEKNELEKTFNKIFFWK